MLDNLSRYGAFLAVAETGSFSIAAKRLFISQPAISASVRKLEKNLGVRLFERKPRYVELTNEGQLLFAEVKRAFSMISSAESTVKSITEAGTLRLAASSVFCKHYLIPRLKGFMSEFPDVNVSITCTSSLDAWRLLDQQEIDLALTARPALSKSFEFVPLQTVEYVFVGSPNYLSKFDAEVDSVLKSGNVMMLDHDNISRKHLDQYFEQSGWYPTRIFEVSNMDLLIEFARMGLGISCVAREFIENDIRDGSLITLELQEPIPNREIGFVFQNGLPANLNILRFAGAEKRPPRETDAAH